MGENSMIISYNGFIMVHALLVRSRVLLVDFLQVTSTWNNEYLTWPANEQQMLQPESV